MSREADPVNVSQAVRSALLGKSVVVNGGRHRESLQKVFEVGRRVQELEMSGILKREVNGANIPWPMRHIQGGVIRTSIIYPPDPNADDAMGTFGEFFADEVGDGWPAHAHPVQEFLCVYEGKITMDVFEAGENPENGGIPTKVEVGAHRWLGIASGLTHRVDVDEVPLRGVVLCFPAEKGY